MLSAVILLDLKSTVTMTRQSQVSDLSDAQKALADGSTLRPTSGTPLPWLLNRLRKKRATEHADEPLNAESANLETASKSRSSDSSDG